jgi:hypothetical protein
VLLVLLVMLNFLRSFRPGDKVLALISGLGTAAWLGISISFGILIGHSADPRVVGFEFISVILIGFNVRSAVASQGEADR